MSHSDDARLVEPSERPGRFDSHHALLDELKVLKKLEHPNVIWLHEVIDEPDGEWIYLVTELYESGSLGDKLRNFNEEFKEHNRNCRKEGKPEAIISKGIEVRMARFYLIDMLKALHYCHNVVGVVHKDIKPDNIVIGNNHEAILIDFGLAALNDGFDPSLEIIAGTWKYFAPELLIDGGDN